MAASPTTCVSAAWDCSRPAVSLIDGWPFGGPASDVSPDLLTGDSRRVRRAACGTAGRGQPGNMIC